MKPLFPFLITIIIILSFKTTAKRDFIVIDETIGSMPIIDANGNSNRYEVIPVPVKFKAVWNGTGYITLELSDEDLEEISQNKKLDEKIITTYAPITGVEIWSNYSKGFIRTLGSNRKVRTDVTDIPLVCSNIKYIYNLGDNEMGVIFYYKNQ